MTIYDSLIKIPFIILLLIPVEGYPQDNSAGSLLLSDTSSVTLQASPHSLFYGMGYGSNMVYMGSTISSDRPYEFASLSYGFSDELYFSVSAFHLNDITPFVAFSSVTASYAHTVNKWFDYNLTLAGYLVPHSLSDTLFSSFAFGDATFGFDWNILYTKVSLSTIISEENRFYFQVRNSRYFQTPSFLKGKAYVAFDPYVNFLFGTMEKYETEKGTGVSPSPPYKPWKKGQPGIPLRYYDVFGPMEADFGLPVSFNIGAFSIEAEPGYILSFYKNESLPGPEGFIFQLTGYFRFF